MFYGSECDLSWWMFHMSLRNILHLLNVILMLLVRVLNKSQLDYIDNTPKVKVSLLNVYLLDVSITERRMLNCLNITVEFLCFFFSVLSVFAWHTLMFHLGVYSLRTDCYIFLENLALYHYEMSLFIFSNFSYYKVSFFWY